jgi:uncharacterized protein YuzE
MSTKDISINRDIDNDILYVIREGVDKGKTTNVSINADILLRLDKTGKVVGLTIEDFSKVLPHLNDCSEYILMENFDFMIEVLNGASHLTKN